MKKCSEIKANKISYKTQKASTQLIIYLRTGKNLIENKLIFFFYFFRQFSHTKQTKTGKLINDLLHVELWRVWNWKQEKKFLKKIFFYRCVNDEFNTGEKRLDSTGENRARIFVWVEFVFFGEGEFPSPPPTHLKSPLDIYIFWIKYFMQYEKKYSWRKKKKKKL